MKKLLLVASVAVGLCQVFATPVFAQFNQVIVFGDSNVDSGFYKALPNPGGGATFNSLWSTAVAHGAGAPTSNPSPLNVQVLAAQYGLTANPANTAGGTNYATSGAKNVTINGAATGGFSAAVPTVTQMQNYYTAVGVPNPRALFVIHSGDNDVSYANGDTGNSPPADPNAYVTQAANDLANAIVILQSYGAKNIIVAGLAYDYPTGASNASKRALKLLYTNTLWNQLDTLGVTYKRADINALRNSITTNKVALGFDFIDTQAGHMACNPVVSLPGGGTATITTAWSLLCSSDAAAPSQYLSPTAPETMLFADDQHLAAKGQRLVGNFLYQIASTIVVSSKAPHDFNGDLKSDVLWRNSGGDITLWLMNGVTASSVTGLGNVGTNWSVVAQRDFNGDSKSDILWRNTGGDIAMWLMNGTTASSVASLGNVATNWSVAATADFNGDGKGDILWRNTAGDVAMWVMNGTSASQVVGLGNVGANWNVAGTADFNGDGKADILWRDTSGNVALWLMNGTTASSVTGLGNIGASWNVAGTADFNGDGKGDILWRSTAGDVAMWLMNGSSVSSVTGLGNIGANWNVASNGDYNGDGKGDVLWRNSTGDIAMWLMNGASVSSVTSLGNITTNWTIENAAAN